MSQQQHTTAEQRDISVATNKSPLRFSLQRGSQKRSLAFPSTIVPLEPVKRSREEEEDIMDGDSDGPDEQEFMPPSPSRPVSNFENVQMRVPPVSNGQKGSRKLVLKNFRTRGNEAQIEEDEKLHLVQAIQAIHSVKCTKHTLEELYRMVANLCVSEKNCHEMYGKIMELSQSHVTAERELLYAKRDSTIGPDFLKNIAQLWSSYCEKMLLIRNVFLPLDRGYCIKQPTLQPIWEQALSIYSEVVLDHEYVRTRFMNEILHVIEKERRGFQVGQDSRSLIRSLLRMLTNLHIYQQVFERHFLKASEDLYEDEGRNLSRDLDISEYIHHVETRLAEEEDRVDSCMEQSTKKPVISVVETKCILNHMASFVPRGLECLLEGDKLEDLRRLYSQLLRVEGGIQLLKTHFTEYIKKHGKAIVMDKEREKEMVANLMEFKNKLDRIASHCFADNEKLVQSLKDSFDYFINTRPNKPAELIAKFVDYKMRAGNKEASDEELDQIMDKVVTLFRFIHGKDVFEAFYKKDLAKRLLLSRSASVDTEKIMLLKLKQECGAGFTMKLEGMFKDMELSKDLAIAFKQHVEHDATLALPLEADFSVFVLSTGHWPSYEYAEITLPPELSQCLSTYNDFYVSRHSGRKLQWQHSLGHCLLKGKFRQGVTKELQVSMYQTIVILLFNEKDAWTFEEIADVTNIEKKELTRTMQSLACGKLRILNKTPKGREVENGDKFEVNSQLNEKLYRIKVSQVQMKETEEEHAATEEVINQDRQYQIDAAIVRVMKTRKNLTHQALIQELFGQLRFPVNSSDLKTRIASLMERDYIARDEKDPNLYNYVS